MKKWMSGILAFGVAVCLAGCGGGETAEPAEIHVSAAASLTDCMNELKQMYESEHQGVAITCNYASSGALQQQIEQGAPADLFFSAGKKQMTALQDKQLMAEDTVSDMLENKVVLITPKEGGQTLADFQALKEDSVKKIAVGDAASVPVGQYTEEIFEHLHLQDVLKDKLVSMSDVRAVLSAVETGNADAGIVYETDAKISEKVQICCQAPSGSHAQVIYPIGLTVEGAKSQAAQDFLAFLKSEPAQQIFIQYGFTPVQ